MADHLSDRVAITIERMPDSFPSRIRGPPNVQALRDQAKQGHAKAQFELGICYASGDGVDVNNVKAAQLYGQAAEQGHPCRGAVQTCALLREWRGREGGQG
jgi:TPR repeat protein